MNHALLAAALLATLAAAPAGSGQPAASPTPMAVPGPKALDVASPEPKATKPAKRKAAARKGATKRALHPQARRARKPGDTAGKGAVIPPSELALPKSAPFYDTKGRYMPTTYIYQETNGEFRILAPGGEARPAAPVGARGAPPPAVPPAEAPPAGGPEPGGAPGAAPGAGPEGAGPAGEAPRP